MGAVRETGGLYIDTNTVVDTSPIGRAVRSSTIQSASHRAVRRRRLRREDSSRAGTSGGGSRAQGASAGSVGVDAGRSLSDGPLPGRGGEDQDRGQETTERSSRARSKVSMTMGAFALTSTNTGRNGGEVSGGPYRIKHQDLTTYCVYTNTPPTGPYRGFGVPQVCWAYESQMDDIARRLGIDPLELRLKNMVHEGDVFVTGDKLVSVGMSNCLKRAAEAVGWQGTAEQAPRVLSGKVRGKGLAVMIKTTMTPSNSSALVRLNADGSAVLLTSSVEIGQGTQTSLAQIVAEELGLAVERVSVTFPDTDVTPFDQSTSSSRTIFTMGSAARQAAHQIRQQLLEIGARVLEADVEDLQVVDGFLEVKGVPEKRRSIAATFSGEVRSGGREHGREL